MPKWAEMPTWMNRLANSLCSVLVGVVLAALITRSRALDYIAVSAIAVAVIYSGAYIVFVLRKRHGTISRDGAFYDVPAVKPSDRS
jgi:hypothetical protein